MSLRDSLKADVKRVCLNVNDFGESALYTVKGSVTKKPILGIFREKFHDDKPFGGGISSTQPSFQCSSADIPDTRQGDIVEFAQPRNKKFYVLNSELKTNGTIFIFLSEDPI